MSGRVDSVDRASCNEKKGPFSELFDIFVKHPELTENPGTG
jgi:hypothetical protein